MPEDIKKIVLLCASLPDAAQVYGDAKGKKLPGFGSLVEGGTWASCLISPSPAAAMLTTLSTGSSPETHGVRQPGDPCRAEYIWEASLRSSKKTSLFGFSVDRPPSGQVTAESSQPVSLSVYLRTNPDWDICLVNLDEAQAKEPRTTPQAIDIAIAEILGAADPETLSMVIGLPEEDRGNGFIALAGPGVKKGAFLKRTVRLEDVVPTLCYLAELPVPADCEGAIVYQALEDPDIKIKELRTCRRNYERLKRSSGPSVMC
jgi:hypothetical protein